MSPLRYIFFHLHFVNRIGSGRKVFLGKILKIRCCISNCYHIHLIAQSTNQKTMKRGYVYFKSAVIFLLTLISSTFMFCQNQYLVNSEWNATFGNDTSNYFYKRATVKTDAADNIYTLGSSITSTGHDFALMKQDRHGDTLFIVNWNGDADNEDIAMDMWIDNSTEYVYVVGGSYQNGTDSLDAVMVVFDNVGAVAYYTYSSNSGAYNDVYTSIASEGSTYLFAGGTVGTASYGYDYLVTTFDFTATEQYQNTYDYGLDDVSVKTVYDPGSGNIFLAGISETSDTTWDYCIASYKDYTLGFCCDSRNYAGSGQTHRPTDAVFVNGFYYVTGGFNNGTDYDIKTVCLDTALTVIWEQQWDGPDGDNDMSYSIKVDNLGNTYVTGKTNRSNYTTDITTIKYDNSGNEMWVRNFDGGGGMYNDVAFDLELNNDNVYITGYIYGGGAYQTICYDTAGVWRWGKVSPVGFAYPTDMAIDGDGNVIIAAPLSYALYTEKFIVLEASLTPILDTAGTPLYREDEIIVCFNPAKVNSTFIDSSPKEFAPIEEVIDSVLIDEMEDMLGTPLRGNREVNIVRIVNQKTTDTVSISRHGYEVEIPPFWATVVLRLPHSYDELVACDSLGKIDDIYFAEPNAVVNLLGANDNHYANDQTSLHPNGTYPNAHIGIDSAWARTVGKSTIKLGVLDNGIWFTHEDFGTATDGSIANSKIEGGKNYVYPGTPIDNLQPYPAYFYWHGTPVSGIIGALRDNTIGVAGIAGGDPDSVATTSYEGVALYDLVTCCDAGGFNGSGYVTRLDDALYEGALSTGAGGFGLHIMNISAGVTTAQTVTNLNSLRRKFLFARDNGVVLVASRGNGTNQDSSLLYPACYNDEWVLNVGGSGTNGLHKINTNGNPSGFFGATANTFSYISKNMDFIAPQAYENVYSLEGNSSNTYLAFGGTSSSAAHVSGTAGLMLSYFNSTIPSDQNLSIEDVEHILEYTATDDSTGQAVDNYDIYSGYGRINAGKAMQVIQEPYYQVLHFTAWLNSSDMVQVANDVENGNGFILNDYALGAPNIGTSGADVDVYKISGTSYHGSWISPSATILGYWIRNTYCDAYDTCYTIATQPQADAHRFSEFNYFNPDSASLFGYLYNSPGLSLWYPSDPTSGYIKLSYTIHTYDSTGQTLVEEQEEMSINLYPNPSRDFVTLQFNMPSDGKAVIRVLDMNGRVVLALMNEMIEGGVHSIPISVQSLQQGMYFCEIAIDNKTTVKKFIKLE